MNITKAISLLLSLLLISINTACADVLKRGNGTEPETLDIHKSSGVPEANIQRDLFEGLITETADGTLIPGMAEKWETDEQNTIWTFHLRKTAKWSDGTPVTAKDFVFAWRRAVKPETGSDYAFILWSVVNAEKINKGDIKDSKKLGIAALDEHTLQVRLEKPTPYFKGLLTHHMTYPLPEHILSKDEKNWTRPNKLISNGAYYLTEWTPQSHITLEKNPHYYAAATVNIEKVIYYPTEDKSSELKRFRAGELDVTEDVPTDQIGWIKENLPQAFRNSPYIGTYYFALNLEKLPFKGNVKLRKALMLAIDRDVITQKVSKAEEVPAWSWIPPGLNGYKQQLIPEHKLDKKAREALALKLYQEAGFDKQQPLKIELLYNTSDNHKKLAIAVAAMWKKVLGVKTQLRNEEWKVYLNSRSQRDFQVIRAGWIGDYNDAYTFASLFKSDVGSMNPSAYKKPQYDSLLNQAENEINQEKRAKLLQNAEKLMLEDMPIIPVYHYTTQHLVNPNLENWIENVMDIHPSRYLAFTETP